MYTVIHTLETMARDEDGIEIHTHTEEKKHEFKTIEEVCDFLGGRVGSASTWVGFGQITTEPDLADDKFFEMWPDCDDIETWEDYTIQRDGTTIGAIDTIIVHKAIQINPHNLANELSRSAISIF